MGEGRRGLRCGREDRWVAEADGWGLSGTVTAAAAAAGMASGEGAAPRCCDAGVHVERAGLHEYGGNCVQSPTLSAWSVGRITGHWRLGQRHPLD